MPPLYADDLPMSGARALYCERNGFGADGGYADPVVRFALGPLKLTLPNTAGRVRAVRYHDLHHVVTDYATDPLGEFEISAWELGAGCRDFWAAWVLNLGGLAGGMLRAPRRTLRAYLRGRHSSTLYGEDLGDLLSESVGQVRARTGVARAGSARAGLADLALLAGFFALGLVLGTLTLCVGLALAPSFALWNALCARSARNVLGRGDDEHHHTKEPPDSFGTLGSTRAEARREGQEEAVPWPKGRSETARQARRT